MLHIRDASDAYIHLLSAPVDNIRGEAFNLLHKNYRVLELAHWVAEVIELRYGVEVRVKRDRSNNAGSRSYFVSGERSSRPSALAPIAAHRSRGGDLGSTGAG